MNERMSIIDAIRAELQRRKAAGLPISTGYALSRATGISHQSTYHMLNGGHTLTKHADKCFEVLGLTIIRPVEPPQ
jgi:hypothetical protein